MNISILIPVSTDLRLRRCIDSIDETVEVVISLNKPSKDIKKQVNSILSLKRRGQAYSKLRFVVCEIDQPSIALAYNNGIKHSSCQNIFLMDSDCVFEKGCIKRLNQNMGNNLLSKGKLVFLRNSYISSVVAKAREHHSTDKISAYSPPLLFSKKIKKYIGGYYFHPSLCWLEDSEFDKRVQKAKLNISYDPEAKVYHSQLSIKRDLYSAFWYGVGKRIGVNLGIHDRPTGVLGSVRKYIIEASKSKGIIVGLYLFIWKMTLLIGYTFQKLFKLREEIS